MSTTPTTSIDALKEDLYDKISEIDNENLLIAINTLIDSIEKKSINEVTNKRDLVGYIKEWVKSM